MKQIEILAPAGSFEGMAAAVNASCDAVYIGGTKFGARAYADNPEEDMLLRAIDYAHIHDKKIYMTVNTLLKDEELEAELYDYLLPYYRQGLDAVIVQDTGAMYFIHRHFPDLPIHASTQMTLTMAEGAQILKPMGVTRLVNSRELTLQEIKKMRAGTDLEIESFVHGALCYCYSGQCLMSSIFGGRSGNRGRCAQPCRMPYQVWADGRNLIKNPDEKYLLCPKDICSIDRIPDLIEAGIDSFKIEGRMKRPEYTAGVSWVYRKYTDRYLELGRERYEAYHRDHGEEVRQDLLMLQDLYNRGGFSGGYYENRNGRNMISLERPGHSGVYAGEVKAVKGNQAKIHLSEKINAQDILEIRRGAENLYEFTVKEKEDRGKDYTVNLNRGSAVRAGNTVYRTKNNELLKTLGEEYLKEERKEPVVGKLRVVVGEKLHLRLSCRTAAVEIYGEEVQEAKNQPVTEEKLSRPLRKTKDTPFFFEKLDFEMSENAFLPVQKLNELRREGLAALAVAVAGEYRRKSLEKKDEDTDAKKEREKTLSPEHRKIPKFWKPGILAEVNSVEQLKAVCSCPEVDGVFLAWDMVPFAEFADLLKASGKNRKKSYVMFPSVFRESIYQLFLRHKNLWLDDTIDGYVIQNFEEFYFVQNELEFKKYKKEVITNYNLYVMNRQAMLFWHEKGIHNFTAPLELNGSELRKLSGACSNMEAYYNNMLVYGRIPLMVSAQCLVKTAVGAAKDSGRPLREELTPCCGPELERVELIDRFQKRFPVKRHCLGCCNTIYNSQILSLLPYVKEVNAIAPENIRLNFTFETFEETNRILNSFIRAYCYGDKVKEEIGEVTRGHFRRGAE